MNNDKFKETPSESQNLSKKLRSNLMNFLGPLALRFYLQMDRRLVGTFISLVESIIRHRHTGQGLVMSELGGVLLSESRGPAGTKRIGNLLRTSRWSACQVDDYISECGLQGYESELQQSGLVLAIWDESVIEKPESTKSEGLCAVRSSKAKRLIRIRPNYYNLPIQRPVHVPGFQWIGLLISGARKGLWVYKFKWWTTRGEEAENRVDILTDWLEQACKHLNKAIHVFDRGFCGSPWLGNLLKANLIFVLRWKQGVKLIDNQGVERQAGQIGKRLRSKSRRMILDANKQRQVEFGLAYTAVKHPDYQQELFLVICRPGKGRKPWYLLTNRAIENEKEAWQIVFIYARRWQIEMAYRFNKSELAIQSPRNKKWEYRLKLMALATLAYVFLLAFTIDEKLNDTKARLLRLWCHRTGKKHQNVKLPIYRIRMALAKLWNKYHEIIKFNPENIVLENSG